MAWKLLPFVALALVCATSSTPVSRKKRQSDDLVFAVIGDWGLVGSETQKEVAAAMDTWVGASGASMVLSMGDNFYDVGVSSVDDPQWDLAWRDVYLTRPNLANLPWYVTLGNKDFDGNDQAQVDFGLIEPLWVLPAKYHTWTMNVGTKTVQFISIYSKVIDEEPDQVTWFTQTIASSTADWLIVCSHHPIMSAGKNGNRDRSLWLIENIKPLLDQYQVALFLQGHDHNLQHIFKEGEVVDYVTSGAGHDLNPQDEAATDFVQNELGGTIGYFGLDYGFAGIRLTEDTATVQYYTRTGKLDYEFSKFNPRAKKN